MFANTFRRTATASIRRNFSSSGGGGGGSVAPLAVGVAALVGVAYVNTKSGGDAKKT